MDKLALALSRCDDLERLIKKGAPQTQAPPTTTPPTSSAGSESNSNYKKDMNKIAFDETSAQGEKYFYTDIFEIPPGMAAFITSCNVVSSSACTYHIELYCNDILLDSKTYVAASGEDCKLDLVACTYIYEKHNKLSVRIYEDNMAATYIISNLKIFFNQAESLTQGNFATYAEPKGKAHIFTAAIEDGINKDGVYQKKYAYAIREGTNIIVGECDADNFAFGQEMTIPQFNTFDGSADFTIQYNLIPATSTAPISYRNLVLLYPCVGGNYYYYKNISTNGNFTGCRLLKGVCVQTSPATKDSSSYYLAATLLSDSRVGLNYMKTNLLGETETTFSTGNWSNVQKLSLTKARNLVQAAKPIPLVLLRENKLYVVIDKNIGPLLVEGITEKITDISDTLFVSDESMDIYTYIKADGYLKKYHLTYDESRGVYSFKESMVIGYGISEFMPLLNGDAFLAYGDSFYYTDKVDRFLC